MVNQCRRDMNDHERAKNTLEERPSTGYGRLRCKEVMTCMKIS